MTTELMGLDGGVVQISADALQAFKASMRGPVLGRDAAEYDETRKVWNAMIDRRPGLIARCSGTADVVQAVRFAREHGLLLSVRGGGHNIAGLAVCEGGLMIDMSADARGVGRSEARAPRARRPAARSATSIARRSCTAWPRCSASSRPPASPA